MDKVEETRRVNRMLSDMIVPISNAHGMGRMDREQQLLMRVKKILIIARNMGLWAEDGHFKTFLDFTKEKLNQVTRNMKKSGSYSYTTNYNNHVKEKTIMKKGK